MSSVRVSVIIPSRGCVYLKYALIGLRRQTVRPYEVVLVLKECEVKMVEGVCARLGLPCKLIEQRRGYFTHALNLGKIEAGGDILLFTDDDAIPLERWIERYVRLHGAYPDAAGIASRDIYLRFETASLRPTPDDKPMIRLYRWLIRPWLERPHPLLEKYKLGVYITKNLEIAHGPCIPEMTCFSLLFRGVNMSFKTSYIYDAWFPEHELLKRAPYNEQYLALQLVLKGFDTIYVPNNPVLHINRGESLSRTEKAHEIYTEKVIMKVFFKELIKRAA